MAEHIQLLRLPQNYILSHQTVYVQSFGVLGYLRTFFHKTSANYPWMESFVCDGGGEPQDAYLT